MESSKRLDRVAVLVTQQRYELAEGELRKLLTDEPEFGDGHALLAICLAEQGKLTDATSEAQQAIHLEPDDAFSHYSLARVLASRERWRESEKALRQAIELDPYDEEHFSMLASILLNQERWQEALDAAEAGLELDPDHIDSINLRAMALRRLGHEDQADASLDTALQGDPDRALTHMNMGWSYIHSANKEKALEHFREALRLDPELEGAREGMVDALHSRNVFYRMVLKLGAWMTKQTKATQWTVVIAGVIGLIALDKLADAVPAAAGIARPLLFLFMAFAALLWISDLVFKLLLRFSRDGRRVLSPDDVAATNWAAVFLVPAAVLMLFAMAFARVCVLVRYAGSCFACQFVVLTVHAFRCKTDCPPTWPVRCAGLSGRRLFRG